MRLGPLGHKAECNDELFAAIYVKETKKFAHRTQRKKADIRSKEPIKRKYNVTVFCLLAQINMSYCNQYYLLRYAINCTIKKYKFAPSLRNKRITSWNRNPQRPLHENIHLIYLTHYS